MDRGELECGMIVRFYKNNSPFIKLHLYYQLILICTHAVPRYKKKNLKQMLLYHFPLQIPLLFP